MAWCSYRSDNLGGGGGCSRVWFVVVVVGGGGYGGGGYGGGLVVVRGVECWSLDNRQAWTLDAQYDTQ